MIKKATNEQSVDMEIKRNIKKKKGERLDKYIDRVRELFVQHLPNSDKTPETLR